MTETEKAEIRLQALQVALGLKHPAANRTAAEIVAEAKAIEQYLLDAEAK